MKRLQVRVPQGASVVLGIGCPKSEVSAAFGGVEGSNVVG
jgi:hypothetical protein